MSDVKKKKRKKAIRISPDEKAFYVRLGLWMRSERQRCRFQKKEIAMAVDAHKDTVSSWEKGRTRMSVHHLAQLTDLFASHPPLSEILSPPKEEPPA